MHVDESTSLQRFCVRSGREDVHFLTELPKETLDIKEQP